LNKNIPHTPYIAHGASCQNGLSNGFPKNDSIRHAKSTRNPKKPTEPVVAQRIAANRNIPARMPTYNDSRVIRHLTIYIVESWSDH
jgi:hypothetical protein